MEAYVLALGWLARRELSERQIRTRLARRKLPPDEIDAAVERLRTDGALDDRRVAGAYARTAVRLKGRGPLRLSHDLRALGIGGAAARQAIDDALAETPEETLIERAVARRAPGSGTLDAPSFARLYRALLRQGFTSEKISAVLRRRGDAPAE